MTGRGRDRSTGNQAWRWVMHGGHDVMVMVMMIGGGDDDSDSDGDIVVDGVWDLFC